MRWRGMFCWLFRSRASDEAPQIQTCATLDLKAFTTEDTEVHGGNRGLVLPRSFPPHEERVRQDDAMSGGLANIWRNCGFGLEYPDAVPS